MDEQDKILAELTKEHEGDIESTETNHNDETDVSGGDKGSNHTEDADNGDDDSTGDSTDESADTDDAEDEEESGDDTDESAESDDSEQRESEPVGEKKDANSRIRQLLEEKKELEDKYNEKIAEERRQADLADDPVYKLDDFLGTVDEDGEVLSDREATARFRAWEADYKLRSYEKQQVMREQQDTLIRMQSETKEAFTKFPEFNMQSDHYDQQLSEIANEAFRAGLIYAPGHEDDDNYIVGSRVNPGQLLEKLHNIRAAQEVAVTKVNNLGDDTGTVRSSQQVNKRTPRYAPGFRGEVDKELDKLMKKGL